MLLPTDLLRLAYDDSLTRAGIEYARKSLHYTYNRMGLGAGARLRKIVAGVAVELAFRRWLDANEVPYDLLGATAFTEKDRYDLRLGGRRCDLKSFLITRRDDIRELRHNPAWLLDAAALVPEDQFNKGSLDEYGLYLFGYITGLEARQIEDVEKALQAEQPVELVHILDDERWLGRKHWRSLGALELKCDLVQPIEVEVGGQGADRQAISERVRLEPRVRAATQQEFYSLLYLRASRLPEGAVGVQSPHLRPDKPHVIAPTEWHNIWVYGLEIFMTGWLTKPEFREQSRKLPAGSRVKQYAQTQTANRMVLVQELRPVRELAERVKAFTRKS
jgi:hypothetical protein